MCPPEIKWQYKECLLRSAVYNFRSIDYHIILKSDTDLKHKTQRLELHEEHNCGKTMQGELLKLQNDC